MASNFIPIDIAECIMSTSTIVPAVSSYKYVWVNMGSYPLRRELRTENWLTNRTGSIGVIVPVDYTNSTYINYAGNRYRQISGVDENGQSILIAVRERKGLKQDINEKLGTWGHFMTLRWFFENCDEPVLMCKTQLVCPMPQKTIIMKDFAQAGFAEGRVLYWGDVQTYQRVFNFAQHQFVDRGSSTFYYSNTKTDKTPNRLCYKEMCYVGGSGRGMEFNTNYIYIRDDGVERPTFMSDFLQYAREVAPKAWIHVVRCWTEANGVECGHVKWTEGGRANPAISLSEMSSKYVSECKRDGDIFDEQHDVYYENVPTDETLISMRVRNYKFKRDIMEAALSPKRMAWKLEHYPEE
jgi:hypothetical protein